MSSTIRKYLKSTVLITILLLSLSISKESQAYIHTLPTNQTSISSLIWTKESIGNLLDISITHEDLIFLYSSRGILYVLSKETGEIQNLKNYIVEYSNQIQIESSSHVLIKLNPQVGEIEVMKSVNLQSLSVLSIDDHLKYKVNYSKISIESRSVVDYTSVIILDRSVYYINNNEILGKYHLKDEVSVIDSSVSYINRREIEVFLILTEKDKESKSYLRLKIVNFLEKHEENEGKVRISLVEEELIQENYSQTEFYMKNFKKNQLKKGNLCNGYDIITVNNSTSIENESIQYCESNYLLYKSNSKKNITWTKDLSYSNLLFFKLFSVESEELLSEHENYSHYQIIKEGIKPDFIIKSIRNIITSFNYLIKSIRIRINSIFTGKVNENSKKNSLNLYILLQKQENEEITSNNSQSQKKNVFILNIQTGEELYSFYERRIINHIEILSNSEISIEFQEKSYRIIINLISKAHSTSSLHDRKGVFTVVNYENNSILKGVSQNKNGKEYIKWQIRRENIIFKLLPNINKHSLVHLPSNGNIFSRILNNNLLFTISKLNSDSLTIELIDGLLGSVLYKSDIKKVDFSKKILPIYNENLLLIAYTYKDKNTLRQEVASFELMSKKAEVSFPLFFEKLLYGEYNEKTIRKDSFLIKDKLIVLTQTYTVESSIKSMYITNSSYSVANKNIVLVTLNNKIILMDVRTFSSRRPILKTQEEVTISNKDLLSSENLVSYSFFIDNDLPVYSPIVRLDEKRILNQNYLYEQVDFIDLSSTTYESTLVLCSKGSRINCYYIYPDKTFDSLPNSFMFELIVVFLVLIYIVAFTLRSFVKKEIFIENWKNSRC